MADNIDASDASKPQWDPSDLNGSLQNLFAYVVDATKKCVDWYWEAKKSKALLSRAIQLSAVLFTAAAGLVPLLGEILGNQDVSFGLWASVLVGAAAAVLGLDKAFGFSTGWTRYVLAATNIRKALEEFRMDWLALMAKAASPPKPEEVAALLKLAKDFRASVEGFVLQETQDWVTEFQSNIAQLEKDVNTQLASMKAEAEKTAQGKEAAAQPGSVQLTIGNADKADDHTVMIKLEGAGGVVAEESVVGAVTWARANVTPGQYRVMASTTIGGKPSSASTIIVVKPGEKTDGNVSLPG